MTFKIQYMLYKNILKKKRQLSIYNKKRMYLCSDFEKQN